MMFRNERDDFLYAWHVACAQAQVSRARRRVGTVDAACYCALFDQSCRSGSAATRMLFTRGVAAEPVLQGILLSQIAQTRMRL